jgi:cobalt-zinc-cadmium efflux system membrane fusion protein
VTATRHDAVSELSVTGVVSPDVSRTVPVVSLSSGRVIDVRARLGDQVHQGQLLLRIQSADVSAAFSDYRKAKADEALARAQLDRSSALFDRGAIAKKDLEVAQDTANKAVVDVETADEHLRVLGVSAGQTPTAIVDVVAPVSGVITEQNVTNAAGVKTLDNSPNLFTISDLSHVWIVCDVYENDLPTVRVGDSADIHLTAYPDRVLTGRISNVSAMLDPSIRTAKVRIEVATPGLLRLGMFVTATFHGQSRQSRAAVPATAILHLHDREWVYVPADAANFQRVEVVSGEMLPGHMQEIVSGLEPGQRVVSNALVLQNTVEQ